MRPIKNPRHEAFANHVALGKPLSRAYELASYKPNRGNAVRMKANESIRRRITQLRKEHNAMTKRTREEHIAKMIERETKADSKGQYAAAQAVARDISQHNNWVTDRKEVTIKQDTMDLPLHLMNDAQRAAWDLTGQTILWLQEMKRQMDQGVVMPKGNGMQGAQGNALTLTQLSESE